MSVPSQLAPLVGPVLARVRRGGTEIALLGVLYVGYSLTRLVADSSPSTAVASARRLLGFERFLGLDLEAWLNGWFVSTPGVALGGSYYYATAHYLVTGVVLLWLWRRGPATYLPARRALVLATLVALAIYLLVPMAPPRLMEGYTDVLRLSAVHGWWGADASAPRGMGGLTNQLAAFPSMHAGWALWVAWVVQREVARRWVRLAAWGHVAFTTVIIVGTANHWLLDAVAGWAVMAPVLLLVYGALPTGDETDGPASLRRPRGGREPYGQRPGPSSSTSAAGSP